MNDIETVRKFHEAIENGNTDQVRSLLSEDFVFDHGADPGKMDRDEFLSATAALQKGIPDLRFNLSDLEGEGRITGKAQVTGTHTGTLDLGVMGGPEVDPTNKSIEGPVEPANWEVRNGKIAEHTVEKVPGGGITGLLEQIGVEPQITG